MTPLPSALVTALEEAIASAQSVTVRAMTLVDEDHLSLYLHGGTFEAQRFTMLSADELSGVSLESEVEPGNGVLVLLGRKLVDTASRT